MITLLLGLQQQSVTDMPRGSSPSKGTELQQAWNGSLCAAPGSPVRAIPHSSEVLVRQAFVKELPGL